MYLAYFDESGDSGLVGSPTDHFILCGVLVHSRNWLNTLDRLVKMRKYLWKNHGISAVRELKATDIRRGKGVLNGLGMPQDRRLRLYRALMKFQASRLTDISVFAVCINKSMVHGWARDPRQIAWEVAIERVETFCRKQGELAMLFPDEGHRDFIKKLTRSMRRHRTVPGHFGGRLSVPAQCLIEDPSERSSNDSYFIQLADWNAYAAHRSSYIHPRKHFPGDLWDLLGDRRIADVSKYGKGAGGPLGIKMVP